MTLIDSIEFISDLRRGFYKKTILKERFEKILLKSYNSLRYGDKVIVESMESISDTVAGFTDGIFTAVMNGVDIVKVSDDFIPYIRDFR